MASSDNEVPQPIIVKKIKKGGGGHHGGAWKVAYADFVTAMMAFFLLMWLLNVTTAEEKNAISNYFDPSHPRVSDVTSGAGGIMGGLSMAPDGAQVTNVQSVAPPSSPSSLRPSATKGEEDDQPGSSQFQTDTEGQGQGPDENNSEGENILETLEDIQQAEIEQLKEIIESAENENFEGIKQKILQEVKDTPELADLLDHLMIDITPEGLRIQIIDKEGRSMFPSGSAKMHNFMTSLVDKVTQIIIPQPNQLSIRGHTDGKPYPKGATYNNWNLSSDRAMASQRAMIDAGLPSNRVENVMGKADREHLFPDEPLSPRNRRISVILLREKIEGDADIRKAAAKAIDEKAAKDKQKALETEERSNKPELDRTIIDGTSEFIIDNNAPTPQLPAQADTQKTNNQQNTESETGNLVGDEIKKIRDRNKQTPAPQPLPQATPLAPQKTEEPKVLEF